MSSMAWNPQLPPVQQGTWADAEYLGDEAGIRADITRRYHEYLDQLGYTDDQGNYIPGSIETNAARTEASLKNAIEQAALGVTQSAQREGTLFSGVRGDRTALAESPYRTGLTNLAIDTPLARSKAMTGATDVLGEYGTRMAPLVAGATARWVPPAITGGGAGAGAGVAGVPDDPGYGYGTGLGGKFVTNPDGTVTYTGAAGVAGTAPNTQYGQATLFPGSATGKPTSGGFVNPNDPDYRNQQGPTRMAAGGLVDGPTEALIGEQGPEAVVPLQGGLQAALARLMTMYGGAQQGQQPQQQQAQQPSLGGQQAQKKRANVHAAGLKAAAKIMTELAKHHEEGDDIQLGQKPTPMQPPPSRMPPQRVPPPRFLGPPVRQGGGPRPLETLI